MKELKQYEIAYSGLKNGVHHFVLDVDDKFFEAFEDSPVTKGSITVDVRFEKKDSLLLFDFELDGQVNTECDRCLAMIDIEVFGDYKLFAKFTDDLSDKEDDEEVTYILRGENSINVANYIYEYIIVSLPMQKTCDDSFVDPPCNLDIQTHLNSPSTDTDKTDEEDEDPRWAALKKLK